MGDSGAFLKIGRQVGEQRPVCERIRDYGESLLLRPYKQSQEQASRCMDCGTPFCHWGCPIGNYIPEWNDLVSRGHWKKAYELLEATNDMPEITGRVCPALCEYACVLGINDEPVTIRENELAIIEHAFRKGFVRPRPPRRRTGKKIAVIGSGPSGLSCAVRLNRAGHSVVVFEKDKKIGGILRYGIPDFKLEKHVIERRLYVWKKEGVEFKTGVNVGKDLDASKLIREFDAVCLTMGSRVPRDLNIEGRGLEGIHYAMDYLAQSNMRVAGEKIPKRKVIDAKDKKVLIIGGGDSGADCVGIAHRQGAACCVQIELLEKPPECRTEDYPWPAYPMILKTSTSHEEGGERIWSILTKRFTGKNGHVKRVSCVKVEFNPPSRNSPPVRVGMGSEENSASARFPLERKDSTPVRVPSFKKEDKNTCPIMKEIPESEFEIEADLVILAVGFLYPERKGLISKLDIDLDGRGNVKTDRDYMTSKKGVFAAGDARKGQSLIVWAISEGRDAAHSIDRYLKAV